MTARDLAMALPEVTEEPHHDRLSYRVAGKIFATVPDADHWNVMLDPDAAEAVVAKNPGCCEVLRWGRRISGVRVDLAAAGDDLVAELLADAWRRRAPKHLL